MHLLSCQPQTVFKKGNIEIDHFEKFRCLHICWSGKITPEDYKTLMMQVVELTSRHKVEFWLFDAREEDNFLLFDPDWSTQFFTSEVVKYPVKKIGRIASYDFHNETHLSAFISRLLKNHQLPFRFKYLPDTNHALEWFLEEEN